MENNYFSSNETLGHRFCLLLLLSVYVLITLLNPPPPPNSYNHGPTSDDVWFDIHQQVKWKITLGLVQWRMQDLILSTLSQRLFCILTCFYLPYLWYFIKLKCLVISF